MARFGSYRYSEALPFFIVINWKSKEEKVKKKTVGGSIQLLRWQRGPLKYRGLRLEHYNN